MSKRRDHYPTPRRRKTPRKPRRVGVLAICLDIFTDPERPFRPSRPVPAACVARAALLPGYSPRRSTYRPTYAAGYILAARAHGETHTLRGLAAVTAAGKNAPPVL